MKAEPEENQVVRIALAELHPFKDHPFRVLDNGEMMEMTESVKEYGILVPVIVRKDENGGYEIVAGRRRKCASELAGLADKIPAARYRNEHISLLEIIVANEKNGEG